MKKFISVLLSFISVISIAYAFTGCGNETIKVRGKFYTLEEAYNNGWLNEDDLKSIACGYYEWRKFEENPYIGMFDPHKELSKENEKELKQAYLVQIDNKPDGLLDKVEIRKYFGEYNRNLIVNMYSDYYMCDILVEPEFNIGGVIFKNFWQGDIRVYHIG